MLGIGGHKHLKRKPNLEYIVHWIIAIAVVMGILGAVIQFLRYGDIIEPGNTNGFGGITVLVGTELS